MVDTAVRLYRDGLLATDYRAGCPVMAVAVEAGDPDISTDVVHAAQAFEPVARPDQQQAGLRRRIARRATELATLVIAALEGALVLARAGRDVAPLDTVHRQLRGLPRPPPKGNAHDRRMDSPRPAFSVSATAASSCRPTAGT